MLKFVFSYLKEEYQEELALLQVEIPDGRRSRRFHLRKQERLWREIRTETGGRTRKIWSRRREKRLFQWVLKKTGSELVFVTEYPEKKRPFYAMDSETHPERDKKLSTFSTRSGSHDRRASDSQLRRTGGEDETKRYASGSV